jgi:hypothetical protein
MLDVRFAQCTFAGSFLGYLNGHTGTGIFVASAAAEYVADTPTTVV